MDQKVCFDYVLAVSSAELKTGMISLPMDKLISLNCREQNGVARIFRHIEKGAIASFNVLFV